MIYLLRLIVLFFLILSSCKEKKETPIWLNPSDVIEVPVDSFVFKVSGEGWNGVIYSQLQPFALLKTKCGDSVCFKFKEECGIIEGPAQLVLSNSDRHFVFDLNLFNQQNGEVLFKDYRSPKTVNPDSSLKQHRIIHSIDAWRNILAINNNNSLFLEEVISINPEVGVYYARVGEPLTAFYVQPGSAVDIPLTYSYSSEMHKYEVVAGPLVDAFGNMVANGTLVVFLYSDGLKYYRTEAHLFNGFAKALIKKGLAENCSLYVMVDEMKSKSIILKH